MSQTHRPAAAALFAAALASSHLVFAQETVPPAGSDPIERPVTLPPATSPVVTTPTSQPTAPSTTATTPLPKVTVEPPAAETAEPTAARPTTRRTATRARAEPAPARSSPAAAPAQPATEAAPAAVAPPSAPAEAAAPPPAALPAPPPAEESGGGSLGWIFGAGALALLVAFAAVALLRRRRSRGEAYEEVYEEPAVAAAAAPALEPEPVVEPMPASAFAPAAAIPLTDRSETVAEPAIEPARVSVGDADPADVEALVASSDPPPGRPWLEFFLRPISAGTDEDSASVEFALTVGNTGSEPARDVRVSAFMFSAGSAAESEMERMLIEPSADAAELDLGSGDAARVEGSARLPTQAADGEVLPVVVADARYRLPDGSEGVMRAAFEIGRAEGGSPVPFRADRPSGMTGELAARLHGEVERV